MFDMNLTNTNEHDTIINCKTLPWLILAPKVWIKIIKMDADSGSYTLLIRAEPGAVLPPHRHVDAAEIFILKGTGHHPESGHFAEGDFVSEHKGAVHSQLAFGVETEMLMMIRGPSAFLDEDGNDMYMMDVPFLRRLSEAAA